MFKNMPRWMIAPAFIGILTGGLSLFRVYQYILKKDLNGFMSAIMGAYEKILEPIRVLVEPIALWVVEKINAILPEWMSIVLPEWWEHVVVVYLIMLTGPLRRVLVSATSKDLTKAESSPFKYYTLKVISLTIAILLVMICLPAMYLFRWFFWLRIEREEWLGDFIFPFFAVVGSSIIWLLLNLA